MIKWIVGPLKLITALLALWSENTPHFGVLDENSVLSKIRIVTY